MQGNDKEAQAPEAKAAVELDDAALEGVQGGAKRKPEDSPDDEDKMQVP